MLRPTQGLRPWRQPEFNRSEARPQPERAAQPSASTTTFFCNAPNLPHAARLRSIITSTMHGAVRGVSARSAVVQSRAGAGARGVMGTRTMISARMRPAADGADAAGAGADTDANTDTDAHAKANTNAKATANAQANINPNGNAAAGSSSSSAASANRPVPPLTAAQRQFLDRALRVNQAGELAATLIYAHQTPPLLRRHPQLRPLMEHMAAQEAGHLATFNTLLARHRVRPTALTPVWRAAAATLGWATGALGREASMACTEAVETEIGDHYNAQVRELLAWAADRDARGEALGPELTALLADVRRIRDEELEHLDHAVEHDAKKAEAYPVLTAVIRGGCRGAIWLSERV